MCLIISKKNPEITYFGTSVSRFQAENFVIPGVDMMPLYLAWLGLASGNPIPALLPRRAPVPVEGVAKFLIALQLICPFKKEKNCQVSHTR